jgi:hypothetical protein
MQNGAIAVPNHDKHDEPQDDEPATATAPASQLSVDRKSRSSNVKSLIPDGASQMTKATLWE